MKKHNMESEYSYVKISKNVIDPELIRFLINMNSYEWDESRENTNFRYFKISSPNLKPGHTYKCKIVRKNGMVVGFENFHEEKI